jgi:hypothetical protein
MIISQKAGKYRIPLFKKAISQRCIPVHSIIDRSVLHAASRKLNTSIFTGEDITNQNDVIRSFKRFKTKKTA